MKKQFGVIHCVAECRNCDWRSENYKNAQACAARHAKAHKHKVTVDMGMCGCYDGTQEDDKNKPLIYLVQE